MTALPAGAATPGAADEPAGRGPDFVQSLERGLAVIRAFGADTPELTLSEVARATGLTRAATRRFLRALAGLGRAAFALVANGDPYTYAGRLPLHVAPLARFELGLDVVAPRSVRARTLPRFLFYATTGRGQTRARDVLYAHDLDRLEAVCDRPTALQVDGEDLGDVDRALFEAERDAVSVLV